MFIFAALSLGFLGSFHCIGMCGPIAMALPLKRTGTAAKIFGAVLYNLGRVCVYALMGLVLGLIGKGIALGGYQQILSILTGVLIILTVLFPMLIPSSFRKINLFNLLGPKLKSKFAQWMQNPGYASLFMIGVLNGFLPCGFVYMALAGAVLTGNALTGILFMVFFGLATIPAMLSVSLLSHLVSLSLRNRIQKTIPYIVFVVGLVLILRGMGLGIPYLSPQMDTHENTEQMQCH